MYHFATYTISRRIHYLLGEGLCLFWEKTCLIFSVRTRTQKWNLAHPATGWRWFRRCSPNIVDNAIKYTEHGTITISAVSYEMFARIDISDTGSGIPESEQAKIFARFYRSNSVQKQEGVGIGLYLARQIISGEGGYIKVASVPGKGSTFSIFLPK